MSDKEELKQMPLGWPFKEPGAPDFPEGDKKPLPKKKEERTDWATLQEEKEDRIIAARKEMEKRLEDKK